MSVSLKGRNLNIASILCELTLLRHSESIDIKTMVAVGEALPAVIRGEGNLLEILMKDNTLAQFYADTFGIASYLEEAGRLAGQISNRFPHINVIEIGESDPFTMPLFAI